MTPALVVFAKVPAAGAVKTRLVPPLAPEEAAALYDAFLRDALDAWAAPGAFGPDLAPAVRLYLAPEGGDAPPGLAPDGVSVHVQRGDGLGARMLRAAVETFAAGHDRVVLIGTDHPTLPADFVGEAFRALAEPFAVVLGPSDDGGYYLLGLNEVLPALFDGSTYKLQVTAASTGAQSNVNVTNGTAPPVVADVLGSFNKVADGKDTVLHVGDSTSGYDVKSSTRDVKDLLPGVTISPVKADPAAQVTIDLKNDVDGMATKIEEMVKAANGALSNIKINSGYNKDNPSASGPFVGDSTTRDLTYKIRNAFAGSSNALPSLAGISVDKAGTITFDKAKFTEAYAKDSAAVQKVVDSVATKLNDVSKTATDMTNGTLTLRIKGEQSMVKDYTDQITRFEDRMTMRQETLSRQFNAMESLLSKMQSQGNWLSGQLATLPTGN